jgi:hypothetical protein
MDYTEDNFTTIYLRGLHLPAAHKTPPQFRLLSYEESRLFTAWYINRLTRLLGYIYHPAVFARRVNKVSNDWVIDPIHHRTRLLTTWQIFGLLSKILATNDNGIRKNLTITLLGILAQLRGERIAKLFSASFENEFISALGGLPLAIAADYQRYAGQVFASIRQEVIDGLIPSAKSGTSVLVAGQTYTCEQYVGDYIQALRNTIHGYDKLQDKQYENILAINKDYLPDTLSSIAPALFIGLLAKPSLFIRSPTLGKTV